MRSCYCLAAEQLQSLWLYAPAKRTVQTPTPQRPARFVGLGSSSDDGQVWSNPISFWSHLTTDRFDENTNHLGDERDVGVRDEMINYTCL
jgi:hypothetical protein